jgi:hypothetical protein
VNSNHRLAVRPWFFNWTCSNDLGSSGLTLILPEEIEINFQDVYWPPSIALLPPGSADYFLHRAMMVTVSYFLAAVARRVRARVTHCRDFEFRSVLPAKGFVSPA